MSGFLKISNTPRIRENVVAKFVVRRDVEEQVGPSLAADNALLGLSKLPRGAFQVAEIMNFFLGILPPVLYCRLGVLALAGQMPVAAGRTTRGAANAPRCQPRLNFRR